MCGCNESKSISPELAATLATMAQRGEESISAMNDQEFKMIEYMSQNRGQHPVYGGVTKTFYGYRASGEKFLVHNSDYAAQPHLFREVHQTTGVRVPPVKAKEVPPPPTKLETNKAEPQSITATPEIREAETKTAILQSARFDLYALPGVTPAVAKSLRDAGYTTPESLLKVSMNKLIKVRGIGETRAKAIKTYVKERYGPASTPNS